MSEDIWDELWRRWDKGEVDPFALVTCFPDFIKKIRAEGARLQTENYLRYEELKKLQTQLLDDSEHTQKRINELKEKAEKWDEEQQLTSREEYEELLLQRNNLVNKHYNKRLEFEKKLEAVKIHMTKWVSEHSDWQMGRMSQWKEELEKVLEAT